jgi:hypothetical protein
MELEVVRAGNVIVTSNWDALIERYGDLHGIPVRLSGTGDDDELVVFEASWFWCKTGSSAPATAPLIRNAQTFSRCDGARSSRTTTGTLVVKSVTAMTGPCSRRIACR